MLKELTSLKFDLLCVFLWHVVFKCPPIWTQVHELESLDDNLKF